MMNSLFLCLAAMSLDLHNSHVMCENSDIILQNSKKYDISPELIVAVGRVESRWTINAKSHANACGVLQVIPKYTKNPKRTCQDLKNPAIGIQVGTKKLKYWIYNYGKGNKTTGLCGYNAGFRCKGKNRNKQGLKYAKSVLKWQKRFKKALIIEKQKFEDKNLLNYLFWLVGNIGDRK